MKLKLLISITIVAILICAVPVSAENVTYSQEYYTFGIITDTDWHKISGAYYGGGQESPTSAYLTFLETRRQTILLEKQNELQAELVKAQWVETCYAPHTSYGAGGRSNETAWKFECADAGYPVG